MQPIQRHRVAHVLATSRVCESSISSVFAFRQAVLNTHGKALARLDTTWVLDEHILQELTGDTGGEFLRHRWSSCVLGGADEEVQIDTALSKSKAIIEGNAFKWSSPCCQAEVSMANDMLTHIKEGTALLPPIKHKEWITQVAVQMKKFCVMKVEMEEMTKVEGHEGDGENGATEMRTHTFKGDAALRHLWDKFTASAPESLQDLKWFNVFRHTLTEEQIKKLAEWRNTIMANTTVDAKVTPIVAKKTKPNKKQKQNEADIHDAAMAFLKMPSRR
eukprot:1188456-Amphidinium_carterae.6